MDTPTSIQTQRCRASAARLLVSITVVSLLVGACAPRGTGFSPQHGASGGSLSGSTGVGTVSPGAGGISPGAGGAPSPSLGMKKGVGTWYFNGVDQALANVRAVWFYNWYPTPNGVTAPAGMQFVPMIWDASSADRGVGTIAQAVGDVLLGFNEPDRADQSNLSVQEALDLWPKLEATGKRLGSPATADRASAPGSWFDQFMVGVASKGLRVDFICLHWYGGTGANFDAASNTDALRAYVQSAHERYGRPVWLTEYSLINWGTAPRYPSRAQQAAFATASVAMLESLPFVERYAWFSMPPWVDPDETVSLYQNGGTATEVGVAYRGATP